MFSFWAINSQVKKGEEAKYTEFKKKNKYVQGSYDGTQDFSKLNKAIEEIGSCNRLFYLALPPSVFQSVTLNLKAVCLAKG